MKNEIKHIIDKLIQDNSFTSESLIEFLLENPLLIREFKDEIIKDVKNEKHDLITNYILNQSRDNKEELFNEICKIHRKPFLTHRLSLSRVVIINEEIFLHILKNDIRFFPKGPEYTSVDRIEEELYNYIGTLYPNSFPKNKKLRKKEIYDALVNLEEISNPPLIRTTKLKPGTGSGLRRRKRYSLTDDGFNEVVNIISLVICDQLENVSRQI